ncbi:uncharacterized protein Z519_06348 [Cladophialophora bantiana CBS 173.52]|uniref:Methyltransferase domain-containing protein n=1 Tax=Cladophialophora bantiana (strain ATCC 10958 / CBS 173.52 / CDC B-1940 / NIH 8579) TaxID=1442370 RepID=A0A0D2ERM7_CLAB1|nr:uncharacterized protein Z519_06348 [Cladophialophora bantiana CBS 173.52]KIW92501.1 hypothetical protein Z519_06348 [Cladophialophora bantiana CBS 173.52]
MPVSDSDSALEAIGDPVDDGSGPAVDETDSGYWDRDSTTQSVTASIYEYERRYDRTYHSFHSGKYLMPNDESEQDRIDIHYHAVRLSLRNTLFFAPIPNPRAILDIGTGTGVWALDAAEVHPDAIVIGTDLSPIQPHFVPTNLSFEIADADEEWTFGHRFDLIHSRIMNDFTLRSWPHYFEQAMQWLTPGGWVECQESDYNRRSDDNTLPPNSRLTFWEREWTRGMQKTGLGGFCRPELVMEQMRNAGFVNVSCRRFKIPIGPWPKDSTLRQAGMFGLVNILDGIQGLSLKVFRELLEYSFEELEALLTDCRREARDRTVHSYWPL